MRSMLFVPGDSDRKLAKSLDVGADALIIDLEDSVATAGKAGARVTTTRFLRDVRPKAGRPKLFVRVNALDTGLTDADLDAVMVAAPDGIILPKAQGGPDIAQLGTKLGVREAEHDLADGSTVIIPIATETARGVFELGTYAGSSPRLVGMSWGGEDLSADIGAETNRGPDGYMTEPFRVARAFTLFAAAAARIEAIDTISSNFRDLEFLRHECEEARRDGFTCKMAIHPAQVPVINDVFTPSADTIARAKAIVAAFAANPSTGVVAIEGEMLDRPHLTRAQRVLRRAGVPM
jgi:citrate lyase subunit beta/citryl-CoA lyase